MPNDPHNISANDVTLDQAPPNETRPGATGPQLPPSGSQQPISGPQAPPSGSPPPGSGPQQPSGPQLPPTDLSRASGETQATPTTTCRSCRAQVPPGYRYCGVCGASVQATEPNQPAYRDPLLGALVGERYRVIERIGSGGMGAVYRVEHVRIGKVAAMKLLHGDLSSDELMVRRFNREARAVSRLTSPYTVSVFDYGRSAGLVYLVMEFLQGKDLGEVLRDTGPLSPRRVKRFVRQIAHSLEEAHQHGVIHRDLKPENLFVVRGDGGERERVKVVDFGLAKVVEAREESFAETKAGTILGTPYYMSPEQIRSEAIDARTDIYSLGGVIYRLLTGDPPYRANNTLGVLQKHLTARPPKVSAVRPGLEAVDAVVAKALAKAPHERYETVTQLAEALSDAISEATTGESSEPGALLSAPQELAPDNVGTREAFDRFERQLKIRQSVGTVAMLAVLGAIAYGFVWGVVLDNFGRHRSESEPNNELGTATRIFLNREITGFIGNGLDAEHDPDIYLVEAGANEGEVASVEVAGVPGLDIEVTVLDSGGRRVVVANSGGVGDPEHVTNLRSSHGVFYIMVDAGQGAANREIPYTLEVTFRDAFAGEEFEPNNGPDEARLLRSGDRFSGAIAWSGDVDVYGLPSIRGTHIAYAYEVTGVRDMDLEVALLDAFGREIEVADHAGLSAGESGVFETVVTEHPRPHFLRVSEAYGAATHLLYFIQADVSARDGR